MLIDGVAVLSCAPAPLPEKVRRVPEAEALLTVGRIRRDTRRCAVVVLRAPGPAVVVRRYACDANRAREDALFLRSERRYGELPAPRAPVECLQQADGRAQLLFVLAAEC